MAFADLPPLPSQAQAKLFELLEDASDPDDVIFRARYIMQDIGKAGGGLDYDAVAGDFVALCEQHALPLIRGDGFVPKRIVVSLSDRATEFGVPNPEAAQFFEAFVVEGDRCIWEQF